MKVELTKAPASANIIFARNIIGNFICKQIRPTVEVEFGDSSPSELEDFRHRRWGGALLLDVAPKGLDDELFP